MADPAAPSTPNPAAPPAAVPVAPAPAATPPAPAASAPPAPAPKKPQQPPARGNKPKFDEERFDQNPHAMKRIRKLAAKQAVALVQEKLGCTLEEAAERVKNAGGSANPPAPPSGAPAPGSDREKEVLRKRVAKLLARVDAQKHKVVATKARARDHVVELELRMDALRAGILDEHADFALSQYRKAVQGAKDAESIQDPLPFFQSLRGGAPYLFAAAGAAPPVVTLRPTSAPPASNQPGGETPAPAAPGQKPPQVDAFKMSDEDWKRHKGSYGFRG